jgi:hypothetical protein
MNFYTGLLCRYDLVIDTEPLSDLILNQVKNINIAIFCDVTLYCLLEGYQRSEENSASVFRVEEWLRLFNPLAPEFYI